MSKKLYEESNIQDIADAIREKNGAQDRYTTAQMSEAIRTIKTTQPDLEVLNATKNGNYVPSADKDGFSSVTVNVEGSGGDLKVWLIKGERLDAIRNTTDYDINIVNAAETHVYTPNFVINYRAYDADKFCIASHSLGGTKKAYLNRSHTNLASIVFPEKIEPKVYSKLIIEYFITYKAGEPRIVAGCGRNIAFGGSGDFSMNLKSQSLINSSTALNTFFVSEIDISAISEPFFFGLYTYDANVWFRNMYLE